MFYDRNSEDIELPNFQTEEHLPKALGNRAEQGKQKGKTQNTTNKKVIIVIIVIAGVIVLGLTIFLVIYFSSKKKEDGGYIFVTHENKNRDNSITIINTNNLEDKDYTIESDQMILGDSTTMRNLEETKDIFSIEQNILKFNNNEKKEGRFKFKITFNKALTTMSGMFKSLKSLVNADLSHLKPEKIKYMNSAFLDCENLEYINFENFNPQIVENMDNCFENCKQITELDLSSFETKKLKSMKSTFKNCKNLSFLDLNKFVLNNVDISNIFENDENLLSNSLTIDDEKTKDLLNSAVNEGNNKTNPSDHMYVECVTGTNDECKECRTEENEQFKCLTCNSGYYIPNYLKNPIKCKQCYSTCAKCTDYMNCYGCKDGYTLNDDKMCVKKKDIDEKTDETDVLPLISDDASNTISIETDISSTDSETQHDTEYLEEYSESFFSDGAR